MIIKTYIATYKRIHKHGLHTHSHYFDRVGFYLRDQSLCINDKCINRVVYVDDTCMMTPSVAILLDVFYYDGIYSYSIMEIYV